MESRIDRQTGEALGRLGHKIGWWPDWTWLAGSVCTVVADEQTGVLKGGADPAAAVLCIGTLTVEPRWRAQHGRQLQGHI